MRLILSHRNSDVVERNHKFYNADLVWLLEMCDFRSSPAKILKLLAIRIDRLWRNLAFCKRPFVVCDYVFFFLTHACGHVIFESNTLRHVLITSSYERCSSVLYQWRDRIHYFLDWNIWRAAVSSWRLVHLKFWFYRANFEIFIAKRHNMDFFALSFYCLFHLFSNF